MHHLSYFHWPGEEKKCKSVAGYWTNRIKAVMHRIAPRMTSSFSAIKR